MLLRSLAPLRSLLLTERKLSTLHGPRRCVTRALQQRLPSADLHRPSLFRHCRREISYEHFLRRCWSFVRLSCRPRWPCFTPELESKTVTATVSTTFRLTTWNHAGCQPAEVAPSTWSEHHQMEAVVLELNQTKAHILCLQECPSPEWAAQHFPDYLLVGSTRSHADFVSLLVDTSIIQKPRRLNTDQLPAVAASIRIGGQEMAVASVHLAPFGGGAEKRHQQLQELQQVVGVAFDCCGRFQYASSGRPKHRAIAVA